MRKGLYRTTPRDLEKRSGERRRMVLTELIQSNKSANQLAEAWELNPNSTYKVLLRLEKRGYCVRGAGNKFSAPFSITDGGKEKLRRLILTATALGGEVSGGVGELQAPLDGPVSLMRIPDIRNPKELLKRHTANQLIVEKKYDGYLTQLITGRLYSRNGRDLTDNFPFLVKGTKFTKLHLIGELIYRDPKGNQDESVVTHIAGTKDPGKALAKAAALPGMFQVVVFDILADEAGVIAQRSFSSRRERLEALNLPERASPIVIASQWEWDEFQEAFDESVDEGGEGVVIKTLSGKYLWRALGDQAPTSRDQWKHKKSLTDEFVVWSAYRTPKGSLMARFGQFWQGELVKVGELNNFSDDLELEIEKLLNAGPFVMEIKFDSRFAGPPGALRFPAFHRIRMDKPITDVRLPKEYS